MIRQVLVETEMKNKSVRKHDLPLKTRVALKTRKITLDMVSAKMGMNHLSPLDKRPSMPSIGLEIAEKLKPGDAIPLDLFDVVLEDSEGVNVPKGPKGGKNAPETEEDLIKNQEKNKFTNFVPRSLIRSSLSPENQKAGDKKQAPPIKVNLVEPSKKGEPRGDKPGDSKALQSKIFLKTNFMDKSKRKTFEIPENLKLYSVTAMKEFYEVETEFMKWRQNRKTPSFSASFRFATHTELPQIFVSIPQDDEEVISAFIEDW